MGTREIEGGLNLLLSGHMSGKSRYESHLEHVRIPEGVEDISQVIASTGYVHSGFQELLDPGNASSFRMSIATALQGEIDRCIGDHM
jgi:hypothetical protein